MLNLVLAESELELVPQAITGHRQVQASSRAARRKPTTMLLDASLHHAAMTKLPQADRRGRPDLVHGFLLTAMDSRANRMGHLRTFVHTRHDEWITIDPSTRLIRNYPRFCGLLARLWETGAVPADKPLIRLERGVDLAQGVARIKPDHVLWFDEAAPERNPAQTFSDQDSDRNVVGVVGGFPHGGFATPRPPGAEAIGWGPEAWTVWTVASELTVRYADLLDSGDGATADP